MFLNDTFDMYQSSPFTSNTNLALPEFVEIMFLDTSNFCKVSAEPLTTTTDCVNSDELRNALICFVSSTEPLSFVLKLNYIQYYFQSQLIQMCIVIVYQYLHNLSLHH